jgi:hypothetical protein
MHIVFEGMPAYACLLAMVGTVLVMVGLRLHDRRVAHREDARRARRRQGRDLA